MVEENQLKPFLPDSLSLSNSSHILSSLPLKTLATTFKKGEEAPLEIRSTKNLITSFLIVGFSHLSSRKLGH